MSAPPSAPSSTSMINSAGAPDSIHVPAPTQDPPQSIDALLASGAVRTLDGELAGDDFAAMAVDYQILLGKIDGLLERLKLDA